MGKCSDCFYWEKLDELNLGNCTSIGLVSSNTALSMDTLATVVKEDEGDYYVASLATRSKFGCILFKSMPIYNKPEHKKKRRRKINLNNG